MTKTTVFLDLVVDKNHILVTDAVSRPEHNNSLIAAQGLHCANHFVQISIKRHSAPVSIRSQPIMEVPLDFNTCLAVNQLQLNNKKVVKIIKRKQRPLIVMMHGLVVVPFLTPDFTSSMQEN